MTLQVLAIADNDARVVPPAFIEANGTFVLDLNQFDGDATIQVIAWPLMAKGQRYWIGVHGDLTCVVADGVTVEAVGTINHTLDRQLLAGVADNASIRLTLHVDFTGGDGTSTNRFDSLNYSVRSKPSIILDAPDFTGSDGDPSTFDKIRLGNIVDPPGLKVTVRKFQGMADGQTITLTCFTALPGPPYTIGKRSIGAIGDYEFFMPKAAMQDIVDALNPANAGFEYTITAPGIDETSPFTRVTFVP
jgi:hypothetical protein